MTLVSCAARGSWDFLKKTRVDFFLSPHRLDLATYAIRHLSIYGKMTSLA